MTKFRFPFLLKIFGFEFCLAILVSCGVLNIFFGNARFMLTRLRLIFCGNSLDNAEFVLELYFCGDSSLTELIYPLLFGRFENSEAFPGFLALF